MNPEYRTGTQIITFRAALPNPDGNFIPGTQASIFLANGNQEALTLPSNAVIRSEDGAHAWVKTGEGTFEPRVAKTGMETFSSVEILERSEEHTSELQSLMRISYAVFCLKKKKYKSNLANHYQTIKVKY